MSHAKTRKAHHAKQGKHAKTPGGGSRPASDGVVYLGLLIIAIFALGLWSLIVPQMFREGVVGLVMAAAFLINLYAWQAFGGTTQANWQQALARIPLRFAGYGKKGARPLDACVGRPEAKRTLLAFGVISVLVVAAVVWWLLPKVS